MRKQWNEKPSDKAELFAALAKAQGEFPEFPKNKAGHGYKYVPLDVIHRGVRPILGKHGLGFTQEFTGDKIVTTVFHSSGQSFTHTFPIAPVEGRMNPMQKLGAQSTYAARYGLCLALGISGDEDTDAAEPAADQAAPRMTTAQAVSLIQGAQSVDGLKAAWDRITAALGKPTESIVKAKDARKAELEQMKETA